MTNECIQAADGETKTIISIVKHKFCKEFSSYAEIILHNKKR